MKTTNKLFYLALPLVLLGCQTLSPGRMSASAGSVANQSASMALAGSPTKAAEVPPTTDVTLTAPEAKGAVISTQPVAEAEQPANFGGLVLSVRWPQPAAPRRTQLIPTTANSLWVKVYTGDVGGAATGSAAPGATPIASRVVGRGTYDQVPGASPTPCCGPQGEERSTVYLSLPPGSVTVWVGTFAEGPTEVSTSSIFLSSAQKPFTITANKVTAGASLSLAANPDVAPAITGVSKAYVAPGQSFTITGKNFGTDVEGVKVNLYQPPGCTGCGPGLYPLNVTSVSSTSVTVSVPGTTNSQQFQLQVEAAGFKIVGGSVGILDKNNLQLAFDTNAKQYWTGSATEYLTAKDAKVAVTSLSGYVCCGNGNDRIDLPLSYVTVKSPSGATMSLDASGSFTADSLGKYDVSATVGDAKTTQKLSAFNTKAALRVGEWDYNTQPENKKYMVLNPLDYISLCTNCQVGEPSRLRWWLENMMFVDSLGVQVQNSPGLQTTDYTVTATDQVSFDLDTERTLNPVSAGVFTVTATLKMAPSQVATASGAVLAASGVEFTNGAETVTQWYNTDWDARVVFTAPGSSLKAYVGTWDADRLDYTWTASPSGIVTIADYGGVTGQATGSAVITATLNKNTSFVAARSITVNPPQ